MLINFDNKKYLEYDLKTYSMNHYETGYYFGFKLIQEINEVIFYIDKKEVPYNTDNLKTIIINSCNLKWTLLNYKKIFYEYDDCSFYMRIINFWFNKRVQIKEDELRFIDES